MVTLNLTFFVQAGLFLLFLYVTNRFFLGPVLHVMDGRAEKITGDRGAAQADAEETARMERRCAEALTEAHNASAQGFRDARYAAYNEGRQALEQLRHQVDQALMAHRAAMLQQVEAERLQYGSVLPGVTEAIDRQIKAEGRLL